jgi:hypothetical protein
MVSSDLSKAAGGGESLSFGDEDTPLASTSPDPRLVDREIVQADNLHFFSGASDLKPSSAAFLTATVKLGR